MAITVDERAVVISKLDNDTWVGSAQWEEFKFAHEDAIQLSNLLTGGLVKEVTDSGAQQINNTFEKLLAVADISDEKQDVDSVFNYLKNI
jgi:hypothetical protein